MFKFAMLCTALLAGTAIAGAEDSGLVDYAELSRTALSAGDLRNGSLFLEKARKRAVPEKWREYTLALADIALRSNDTAGTRRLLDEFAAGYPEDDRIERAVLAARLAAAEGQVQEACGELEALLTGGKLNNTQLGKSMNALGEIRMNAGEYLEAAEIFGQAAAIANTPEQQFTALCRRIYALQLGGRTGESAALLAEETGNFKTAERAGVRRRLWLNQLAVLGDMEAFDRQAEIITGADPDRRSDFLLSHALCTAGDKVADTDSARAEKYYRRALDFAGGGSRQNILHKLSNTLLKAGKNAEAAEVLREYAGLLDRDSGRDSLEKKRMMLMQSGRLFASAGKYDEALEVFGRITSDDTWPDSARIDAAREAAAAAGTAGKPETAEKNLLYMTGVASSPDIRQEAFLLLGEHYFRQKEFGRACEAFENAAAEPGKASGKANVRLLQVCIQLKDFDKAGKLAAVLRESPDKNVQAAAWYLSAVISENTGDMQGALRQYMDFAGKYSDSEYAAVAGFNAAEVAEKLRDYKYAMELYGSFASKYHAGENAANALFRAMQCAFLAGDDDAMRKFADRLNSDYESSPFAVAALFRQVDYLCGLNRLPAALAVLERINSIAGGAPDVLSRVLCDQARIHARMSNGKKAMALIQRLLRDYPGSPAAADGALLGGNLSADKGDYARALDFYAKALDLRRDDRYFAGVCSERIADCHLSAFALDRDTSHLAEASKIYSELATVRELDTASPALFKLGRVREKQGELRQAVNVYSELLYRTLSAGKSGGRPESVWPEKAAYAAVSLLLRKGTAGGAAEAVRILELAKRAGAGNSGSLDDMIKDIRRKYRL